MARGGSGRGQGEQARLLLTPTPDTVVAAGNAGALGKPLGSFVPTSEVGVTGDKPVDRLPVSNPEQTLMATGDIPSTATGSRTANDSAASLSSGVSEPRAVTLPALASDVDANSATLKGFINPGGSDTTWWFEYGPSNRPATFKKTSAQTMSANSSPAEVSTTVTGLTWQATYYYRIVGTNAVGVSSGRLQHFRSGLRLGLAPSLGPATVGASYSGTITAVGGVPAYSWIVNGSPLSINASTTLTNGLHVTNGGFTLNVRGTPNTPGTVTLAVAILDSTSNLVGPATYTVPVNSATQTGGCTETNNEGFPSCMTVSSPTAIKAGTSQSARAAEATIKSSNVSASISLGNYQTAFAEQSAQLAALLNGTDPNPGQTLSTLANTGISALGSSFNFGDAACFSPGVAYSNHPEGGRETRRWQQLAVSLVGISASGCQRSAAAKLVPRPSWMRK